MNFNKLILGIIKELLILLTGVGVKLILSMKDTIFCSSNILEKIAECCFIPILKYPLYLGALICQPEHT